MNKMKRYEKMVRNYFELRRFLKMKNTENFVAIETAELAEQFLEDVYGTYCNQYIAERKTMEEREYLISELSYPLEFYLGHGHARLNNFLRNREYYRQMGYEAWNAATYDAVSDRINEITVLAPTAPSDLIVYRGVDRNEYRAILQDCKKHTGCIIPSFVSTSLLMEEALNHTDKDEPYLIKIYVPAGSHCLGIAGDMPYRGEYELIFPKNSSFSYKGKVNINGINCIELYYLD